MGKVRLVAVCLVALIALGVLGSACSSDGKSKAQAQRAAQNRAKANAAKARRARAATLQRRRQAARRAAAQRAAALRRRQAQKPPVTVPPVTVPPVAPATPAADLAAIQRTFAALNAAFRKGVPAGIVASVAANYWVGAGHYTGAQCVKYEANRGQGVVSEAFTVRPGTLKPDPTWVDPTVGRTPTGRIYSFTVDNTQTLVPTRQQRQQTAVMHSSVNPAGVAFLFFRCA